MVFRADNALRMVEWWRFLLMNHIHNDMVTLFHTITVSEVIYVCSLEYLIMFVCDGVLYNDAKLYILLQLSYFLSFLCPFIYVSAK